MPRFPSARPILPLRPPAQALRRWSPASWIRCPAPRAPRVLPLDELLGEIEPLIILVGRKFGGPGVDPKAFSLRWFMPSLWRYRRPLGHVLLASLFVQIFALVTPLMFQVVIDKVLAHKSYSTLFVIVAGLAGIGV